LTLSPLLLTSWFSSSAAYSERSRCARFWEGGGLGATVLAPNVTPVQFVVELLLTFFLVNTIFNTAVNKKAGNHAPIAIGLTLTFALLMGIPLTGASLNPARTLGPAIMTGNYANLSIYMIAQPLGGILAALLYQLVLRPEKG
jgi:glycerol uptake facilitator-like aquaporin